MAPVQKGAPTPMPPAPASMQRPASALARPAQDSTHHQLAVLPLHLLRHAADDQPLQLFHGPRGAGCQLREVMTRG